MSQTILQFDEPKVATATVTVRMLQIGNKAMTQGLFRQLPRAALFNDDGSLLGTAWGHVNYHHECGTPPDRRFHRHVIWQGGTTLYRCDIWPASDGKGKFRDFLESLPQLYIGG